MKKEQALKIAENFYRHREGKAPEGMIIKRMEPAGGRIIIWSDGYDREEGEPFNYEIEIDPTCGNITMKKILCKYRLEDFSQEPKMLSELKQGDTFRMQFDCVLYEFWKPTTIFGSTQFLISRHGQDTFDETADQLVYPC